MYFDRDKFYPKKLFGILFCKKRKKFSLSDEEIFDEVLRDGAKTLKNF